MDYNEVCAGGDSGDSSVVLVLCPDCGLAAHEIKFK